MKPPFVTIIIPCRNEEAFIGACLDSILGQDYPSEQLEILVADGMSTDHTRTVLQTYSAKDKRVRWFENPKKIVPVGLNILIREAKGEIIIRIDVHSQYNTDYVSQCVKYLLEYGVDNVGGILITKAGDQSLEAEAIAYAVSSRFGIGNADFRTGSKTPKFVDTVPFGCFKREVFDQIGLFDEDLVRNQDDEFNSRIIKNGGKILLVPEIISTYYARSSFTKLWRMYFQYGYFKPLTVIKLGGVMTARQLIPVTFIASLLVLSVLAFCHPLFRALFLVEASLYLSANLLFSLAAAMSKNFWLFPYLMVSFATIHFAYGVGYIKGILDFVLFKRHLKNKVVDMALSR